MIFLFCLMCYTIGRLLAHVLHADEMVTFFIGYLSGFGAFFLCMVWDDRKGAT